VTGFSVKTRDHGTPATECTISRDSVVYRYNDSSVCAATVNFNSPIGAASMVLNVKPSRTTY